MFDTRHIILLNSIWTTSHVCLDLILAITFYVLFKQSNTYLNIMCVILSVLF